MAYEGDNRRKWHVTREISITDLVGLATACGAVLVAYGKLDTRLALVEQFNNTQAIEMERQNKRLEEGQGEINHKLDRLIEKGAK